MKRSIYILLIFFLLINSKIFSKNLILPKKAAKIGNEILLENEIKKYVEFFKTTYKEAKQKLIEYTLLYVGATMYAKEPDEENVKKKYKEDKAYFASMLGKAVKNITDDEFLANLHYNHKTVESYMREIKKDLWIKNYLRKATLEEKLIPHNPTDKEINDLKKNNPELFEEKESVILSLIFFSFFEDEQKLKSDKQVETLIKKSKECLNRIVSNEDFEELVMIYSDDVLSVRNSPRGRFGILAVDDPRSITLFGKEIVNALKNAKIGVIEKIFENQNGLYIFKIDSRIEPKKLSPEASRMKAVSHLGKKYEDSLNERVRSKLIDYLKTKISIIEY